MGISSFGETMGGIFMWICEEGIKFFIFEIFRKIVKFIVSLVKILMFPDHFSFAQPHYEYPF
jgi:hypothetical protein